MRLLDARPPSSIMRARRVKFQQWLMEISSLGRNRVLSMRHAMMQHISEDLSLDRHLRSARQKKRGPV